MRGTSRFRVSRSGWPVSRDFERGEFLGIGLDRVGQLEQQSAAFRRGKRTPGREGLRGSLDRPIDVALARLRDLSQQPAIMRD